MGATGVAPGAWNRRFFVYEVLSLAFGPYLPQTRSLIPIELPAVISFVARMHNFDVSTVV
jgi:hypothetical protein